MKQIMGKFNVGDKVRYKSGRPWSGPLFEYQIMNGDVGVVNGEGYYEGHVLVKFGVTDYVPIDELELIETSDKKHEFLQRLQSLLREFDASISYFIGDDEKYGWSDYPFLKVGNEVIKYPAGDINEITAYNIMDFDKE